MSCWWESKRARERKDCEIRSVHLSFRPVEDRSTKTENAHQSSNALFPSLYLSIIYLSPSLTAKILEKWNKIQTRKPFSQSNATRSGSGSVLCCKYLYMYLDLKGPEGCLCEYCASCVCICIYMHLEHVICLFRITHSYSATLIM